MTQHTPGIHHSGHRVQYAATAYVQLLEEAGVRINMAEVGQVQQNGYARRIIKGEEVDLSKYQDYLDAYWQFGQPLEDACMKKQTPSSMGCLTPVEFEVK